MTAINASRDRLNYSDLLAFLYKWDTMNLLNYAIPSDVELTLDVPYLTELGSGFYFTLLKYIADFDYNDF